MPIGFTRREFLKLSLAAAAGAVLLPELTACGPTEKDRAEKKLQASQELLALLGITDLNMSQEDLAKLAYQLTFSTPDLLKNQRLFEYLNNRNESVVVSTDLFGEPFILPMGTQPNPNYPNPTDPIESIYTAPESGHTVVSYESLGTQSKISALFSDPAKSEVLNQFLNGYFAGLRGRGVLHLK